MVVNSLARRANSLCASLHADPWPCDLSSPPALSRARSASTPSSSTPSSSSHEPVVDAVVAHLHRIDQPDVLNPQRLARAYDGAVVVLVGAPLDDAEDAGGPRAYRGLRLAQEPVGELGSVEVSSLGHRVRGCAPPRDARTENLAWPCRSLQKGSGPKRFFLWAPAPRILYGVSVSLWNLSSPGVRFSVTRK